MPAECLLALNVCDRRFLVGCALSLVGALGSLTTTLAQVPAANPAGRALSEFQDGRVIADDVKQVRADASRVELCVMKADGTEVRVVTKRLPGFTELGSPEWSSDSAQIALDMSRGSVATSHIVLVNSDGSNPQDLGPGCMPSFSPDGKRIVFSNSGQGIMLMNSDGTGREMIDRRGWGVQWSPDGKYFAIGRSGDVVLLSVEKRDERLLLVGDQANRYSSVYWNLGWSHDSRWIAFKGRNRRTGEPEVAVVDVGSPPKFRMLYNGPIDVNTDFSWSPDNRQVLLSMDSGNGSKLFLLDREATGGGFYSAQPARREVFDCAWSPDGQHIAFSSNALPEPIEPPRFDR